MCFVVLTTWDENNVATCCIDLLVPWLLTGLSASLGAITLLLCFLFYSLSPSIHCATSSDTLMQPEIQVCLLACYFVLHVIVYVVAHWASRIFPQRSVMEALVCQSVFEQDFIFSDKGQEMYHNYIFWLLEWIHQNKEIVFSMWSIVELVIRDNR